MNGKPFLVLVVQLAEPRRYRFTAEHVENPLRIGRRASSSGRYQDESSSISRCGQFACTGPVSGRGSPTLNRVGRRRRTVIFPIIADCSFCIERILHAL
jgi:hypothetical protein